MRSGRIVYRFVGEAIRSPGGGSVQLDGPVGADAGHTDGGFEGPTRISRDWKGGLEVVIRNEDRGKRLLGKSWYSRDHAQGQPLAQVVTSEGPQAERTALVARSLESGRIAR